MTIVERPVQFDRREFERMFEQLVACRALTPEEFGKRKIEWEFCADRYSTAGKDSSTQKDNWYMTFEQFDRVRADAAVTVSRFKVLWSGNARVRDVRAAKRWHRRTPSPIGGQGDLDCRIIDLVFAQTCEVAFMHEDLAALLARLETAEYRLEQAVDQDELSQAAVLPLLAPLRLTGEAVREQVRSLASANVATEVSENTEIYSMIAGLVKDAEAYVERHREARAELVNDLLSVHHDTFAEQARNLRSLLAPGKTASV